mmetsp:Transcript_45597/g.140576  ORF Transcript_45597/g.140576 Transcript_45597/m.140576 type:complete len:125 (-) Transcript_45597:54-428(-)
MAQKKALQARADSSMAVRDEARRAASTQPSPTMASAPGRSQSALGMDTESLRRAARQRGKVPTPQEGQRTQPGRRHRANGLPTLEFAAHCSSRRTKFYTNYDGKRIMMDPCDWPEEHDFVLIGT